MPISDTGSDEAIPSRNAGGAAAAAGLAFQALVGARLAARMLSESSVGSLFDLPPETSASAIRFETEQPIDDIQVQAGVAGRIHIQVKTSLDLSPRPNSPLASVLEQFVRQWISEQRPGIGQESRSIAYVLVVSSNAPQRLRTNLAAAFHRARAASSLSQLLDDATSEDLHQALSVVVDHIRRSHLAAVAKPIQDDDVVSILRRGRLVEMPAEVTSDFFDAERNELRARALDPSSDPTATFISLRDVCLRFCAERSGGDSVVFRTKLASAGIRMFAAPTYRADIERLMAETTSNLERESDKTSIRVSSESHPANRPVVQRLWSRLGEQSVLISGEPGCGKTGMLVQVATRWRTDKGPVLFLSVDRHAVSTSEDLRTALRLANHIPDVLRAWDGQPGLLVVDALDAARGGEAERVYRNLIETVLKTAPGWTICASIRTFDLNNSRVFKEMARPFGSVHVPVFSQDEVHELMEASPKIADVLGGVSASTFDLLRNPFNLQLAVEVVELESGNAALAHLTNQAALLRAYWNARLPDFASRHVVEKVVLLMIQHESLVLQASDLTLEDAEAIPLVLVTGVIVNEDALSTRIAFRHHILFDFAASLAKFGGTDIAIDVNPLTRETGLGFVLAPALRFHLQRIWDRAPDRETFWRYVAAINGQTTVDPIARAATARAVVELVRQPSDVVALIAIFGGAPRATASALQEVMQEARLGILAKSIALDAWAYLADALMDLWGPEPLYPVRLLLLSLCEAPDLGTEAFVLTGSAARKYLRKTLVVGAPPLQASETEHALRAVAKTYRSKREDSRADIEVAISTSEGGANREDNLRTLCGCINDIIDADPEFAATIFEAVFATPSPGDETTSLGGSQILSLTSTRRQDFESCFWSLGQSYPRLWARSSVAAVRAVVSATRSHILFEHPISERHVWNVSVAGQSFELLSDYSFIWAAKHDDNMHGRRAGYVIAEFSKLLRTGADGPTLAAVGALLSSGPPALLWARAFSAATERPGLLGDQFWPLLRQAPFFECPDTSRDAIDFLEAIWSARTQAEKDEFEVAVLNFPAKVQELALSALPVEKLSIAADAKRALEAAGPLVKPHRTSFETTRGEYDWVRDAGVSVDAGPNADLRAGVDAFEAEWPEISADASSSHLTVVVEKLVALVDRTIGEGADWRVIDEAWSSLADKLQKYFSLADPPGVADFGLLARSVLLRMSRSSNPEAGKQDYEDSGLMSWGSPAPRLEAAAALILAARQPNLLDDELRGQIVALLHDDVPTVRLQIVQALNAMWETDRPFMWSLVDDVATNERSNGVLQFFIGGTLGRIMHAAPERVGAIVAGLVDRIGPMEGEARDRALEQAADLLSILWFWRNWAPGEEILRGWLASMASNEVLLWHAISQLRDGLIAGIAVERTDEDTDVRRRTQAFAKETVFAAKALLDQYRSRRSSDQEAGPEIRSAAKLLDHVVMEIYFASGAYSDSGKKTEPAGLQSTENKLLFLDEMSDTLWAASSAGTVHTLHQLLEVLEYLMPGAPERCIDMAFATVLDSAEGRGYAVEQMGADLFVRIIRTSLADYRDVFVDKFRRARLLDALDRFLQAGNPEARRLLHELPDALR